MNFKNATILLLFLLCILGLMIGVYYSESTEPTIENNDYKDVVNVDTNGTITIELELKEKNNNSLKRFFT